MSADEDKPARSLYRASDSGLQLFQRDVPPTIPRDTLRRAGRQLEDAAEGFPACART